MNRFLYLGLSSTYAIDGTNWRAFQEATYGGLPQDAKLTPVEEIGCSRFASAEAILRDYGETLHYYRRPTPTDPDAVVAELTAIDDPDSVRSAFPLTVAGANQLDGCIYQRLDHDRPETLRRRYHIQTKTPRCSEERPQLDRLYIYWYLVIRDLKYRGYKYVFNSTANRIEISVPQDLVLARPHSDSFGFSLHDLIDVKVWCRQAEDPLPRIYQDILTDAFDYLTPLFNDQPSYNRTRTSVLFTIDQDIIEYDLVPAEYNSEHYFEDFDILALALFDNVPQRFWIWETAQLLSSFLDEVEWNYTPSLHKNGLITFDAVRKYTSYNNDDSGLTRFLTDLVHSVAQTRCRKKPR